MKRWMALLLSVAVLIGCYGCSVTTDSPGESDDESTSSSSASNKIGILVPMTSEFFSAVNAGSTEVWEDAGYQVIESSFDSDQSKLIEMIENYVAAGVDMICTNPGGNAGDDALKAAMDAGVKVMVYGSETADYDLCMVADEYVTGETIGEMAANYVNEYLGGNVQAVALTDTSSQDTTNRTNGMLDKFKELCPNAEIVGSAETLNVGEGTEVMENFLQRYPDVQVVLAHNDVSGIEAMEVLNAAGKTGDEYAVFGCDGTTQGFKLIKDGSIFRGTVSFGALGKTIGEYGLNLLNGEYETHHKEMLPCYGVTEENIDEFYSE